MFEPLRAEEKLFLPFRYLIVCQECGYYMIVPRSCECRGKYYINAYYIHEGRPHNPKGIRVSVILEDIYMELTKLHFGQEHHDEFVKKPTHIH